jgi:hypothetical protein
VRRALAQEGGDVDVLNFALTLEYLEATFYGRAISKGRNLSADTRRLVREVHDNEAAHVDALRGTIKQLGGAPVAAPKIGFGDVFTNERTFLDLAQTLEDTGVSAYNGAAPQIRSSDVLAAAGSIVQGRGPPRGADPPHARRDPRPGRVRHGPRQAQRARGRHPVDQVLTRQGAFPCRTSDPWSSSSSWRSR